MTSFIHEGQIFNTVVLVRFNSFKTINSEKRARHISIYRYVCF